jgi:four helix bundle protein
MNNFILEKSKLFAIRIVNLYKYICETKKEFVLSKQLLRCGTSIGANLHEANYAQSKKEFISKMQISLKEAGECEYWLELLYETEYLSKNEYESISKNCSELNRLLISSLKSAKSK